MQFLVHTMKYYHDIEMANIITITDGLALK